MKREVLPRRVRVLHFIHTMAYGGVETAVLNWVRTLDPERFEVHLACFANPGGTERPFIDAAHRLGLKVSTVPWHRGKPVLRAARALAELLRERSIDIVHAHNTYADLVTVVAARKVPVKTITTAYVWFEYDSWRRNLLQRIDAAVMRRFDCVTAHCEHTRTETIKRGFHDQAVRTLICGFETHRVELSTEERNRRRAGHGAAPGDPVLVNVARLYPEKAQDFLLECFARILENRPDAWLWLAGVGPLEGELRYAAQRMGVANRVRFLGFVADLPSLLALADVQVHPARIEGVPLAICEGMAAGLPIVASEVGGLPEVLAGGTNGVLVPGLDAKAFSHAALRVIDDRDHAQHMGQRARRFIENDYSLRSAVRRVEATYAELVPC